MIRIVKIPPGILLLLMLTVSSGWCIEIGEPLPDFSIRTFEGSLSSRAALEGKPSLLIFWNTWCPFCMEELPKVNRVAEKFAAKGLTVLAINTAINDSESKARAYWERSRYVFPSGFDPYFDMTTAFGVRGVPTIFLVDTKGIVRYKQALLPGDLDERLKQLGVK